MIRIAKLMLASICLCGWFSLASAQDVEPSDMVRAGLQALQMVDQNKIGEIWDGGAVGARKKVTRASFIEQVGKARSPLGAPQQRTWVAINRQVLKDADADLAGQYVSVEYESRFANKPGAMVRELVSFHLDSDRVWRFSGYVLR